MKKKIENFVEKHEKGIKIFSLTCVGVGAGMIGFVLGTEGQRICDEYKLGIMCAANPKLIEELEKSNVLLKNLGNRTIS